MITNLSHIRPWVTLSLIYNNSRFPHLIFSSHVCPALERDRSSEPGTEAFFFPLFSFTCPRLLKFRSWLLQTGQQDEVRGAFVTHAIREKERKKDSPLKRISN